MQASRKVLSIFVLVFVVVGVNVGAEEKKAAKKIDPSGTWTWERTRGDRVQKRTLVLKLDGDKLTGTYKGRGDAVKIEKAKLDGDKISFQYMREFREREVTVKYQGKVTESKIVGTVEFAFGERSRTRDWEATRSVVAAEAPKASGGVSELLGKWAVELDIEEEEEEVGLTLTFSQDDAAKLKGSVEHAEMGRTEMKDLRFEGNRLSFEAVYEFDEFEIFLGFNGKVNGDSLTGTVEFEAGDESGEVAASGRRESQPAKAAAKPAAQSVDVVGKWNIEVETEGGETRKSSLTITKKGEKLAGVYKGRFGEQEIEKIRLTEDRLSFELTREFDDFDLFLAFKGTVKGDSFHGRVRFEAGDREGEREFIGRREAPKKEKPRKRETL